MTPKTKLSTGVRQRGEKRREDSVVPSFSPLPAFLRNEIMSVYLQDPFEAKENLLSLTLLPPDKQKQLTIPYIFFTLGKTEREKGLKMQINTQR